MPVFCWITGTPANELDVGELACSIDKVLVMTGSKLGTEEPTPSVEVTSPELPVPAPPAPVVVPPAPPPCEPDVELPPMPPTPPPGVPCTTPVLTPRVDCPALASMMSVSAMFKL